MIKIFYCTKLLLLSVTLFFISQSAKATVYEVPHSVDWIRQINTLSPGRAVIVYNSLQVNAQPGDTFALIGGTRNPIRIDDLRGDSLNPILFLNKSAQVIITKPVGGYFGLSFLRCRYLKISGRSNPTIAYGIKITNLPSGSGISLNDFTSNVEIEGVEIGNIFSSGIVAKTDPVCSNLTRYPSFTMYDIKIHHNYIHHVGNEGLYIGNTFYNDGNGWRMNCTNPTSSTVLFPHRIIGVQVYENFIDSTGWDGIQLASCFNGVVRNNYVTNDSYKDATNQTSGILIGQPSQINVFNNTILNSMGAGIQSFGVGTRIYNNLILYPGQSPKSRGSFNSSGQLVGTQFTYGIYVNDKVCRDTSVPRLPYVVAHNTIIINKVYRVGSPYNTWAPQGINGNSMAFINGSFFGNNLVLIDSNFATPAVNPIQGVYASNSVPGYSIVNNPSFVSINSRSTFSSNYFSNELNLVNFNGPLLNDYTLQAGSNAVNTAVSSTITNNPYLNLDILGVARPQGGSPDFGAYERFAQSAQGGLSGMLVVPNPISLSGQSTFEVWLNDNTIQNPEINVIGLDQNYSLPIESISLQNDVLVLTLSTQQLPVQSGLWSIQVSENNQLKANALFMIIP